MRDRNLKELLKGDSTNVLASVFSPMTARMANDIGYKCGIVGGSIASMALLGYPDLSLISQSELVEFVKKVAAFSDLPILVDGDAGYGNALNAMRLVIELEHAGAAGVTLEDTRLPIAYKAADKPQLIPQDEHVMKLRAALDARRNENFVIIARTSFNINDVDDFVRRVSAYSETGVDGICVVGAGVEDHFDTLIGATDLPLMLITYGGRGVDWDNLPKQFKLALKGHAPFTNGITASYNSLLAGMDDSGAAGEVSQADIVKKYCLYDEMNANIEKYLS